MIESRRKLTIMETCQAGPVAEPNLSWAPRCPHDLFFQKVLADIESEDADSHFQNLAKTYYNISINKLKSKTQ
jgi:hypothetical protein